MIRRGDGDAVGGLGRNNNNSGVDDQANNAMFG